MSTGCSCLCFVLSFQHVCVAKSLGRWRWFCLPSKEHTWKGRLDFPFIAKGRHFFFCPDNLLPIIKDLGSQSSEFFYCTSSYCMLKWQLVLFITPEGIGSSELTKKKKRKKTKQNPNPNILVTTMLWVIKSNLAWSLGHPPALCNCGK
jgi:hypothetical protein